MSLEVLTFSLFTCSETRIPCFDNWGSVSFPWVLWAVTLVLQTWVLHPAKIRLQSDIYFFPRREHVLLLASSVRAPYLSELTMLRLFLYIYYLFTMTSAATSPIPSVTSLDKLQCHNKSSNTIVPSRTNITVDFTSQLRNQGQNLPPAWHLLCCGHSSVVSGLCIWKARQRESQLCWSQQVFPCSQHFIPGLCWSEEGVVFLPFPSIGKGSLCTQVGVRQGEALSLCWAVVLHCCDTFFW